MADNGTDMQVNLLSDTQTQPTPGMRRAMAEAEVGDEQRFEDPTVNQLVDRVAELLGHPAAVFLPSGTMCNEIALRLHVRPGGDEVLLHRTAHPLGFEAGGPSAISGAVLTPLEGDGGMFDVETLRRAIRPPGDRYAPRTRLLSVEQTTNLGGGRVWPHELVEAIVGVAVEHGLRTHLDGARLMNAVAASGVAAASFAGMFDTAWIDFSKGLGAPFGAVLAGERDVIDEAWRYKQMMGGAMRQAGIMAAGCLYALDHQVERLTEDHANARYLAEGLDELPEVELDPALVESNIVVFSVPNAPAFEAALEEHGVRMGAISDTQIRAVTHLDVGRAGIEHALTAARKVL